MQAIATAVAIAKQIAGYHWMHIAYVMYRKIEWNVRAQCSGHYPKTVY